MQYVHGVKGIFTAHGASIEDIFLNPILNNLYKTNIFDLYLFIEENRDISKCFCNKNKKGEYGNLELEHAI